jgi:hypothetical protein
MPVDCAAGIGSDSMQRFFWLVAEYLEASQPVKSLSNSPSWLDVGPLKFQVGLNPATFAG